MSGSKDAIGREVSGEKINAGDETKVGDDSDESHKSHKSVEILSMRKNYEAKVGQTIFNLRERSYSIDRKQLDGVLEQLPGESSPIWPVEKAGPLLLDGPLQVGAAGGHGHGRINYVVVEHQPNERLMFRFTPEPDQHNARIGVHYLEFVDIESGVSVRYVVNAEMRGESYQAWVDGIRERHNEAVDNLFEKLGDYIIRQALWEVP